MLQSGKSLYELCDEYYIQDDMIRHLFREYDQKKGSLTKKREPTDLEVEFSHLKKELRETKLKYDILKKTESIFSKNDS